MNHYEEVLKIIKGKESSASIEQGAHSNMFKHFLELLGEHDFNNRFESYFIDNFDTFDECFYYFHKSMRQCDFYSDHYKHVYGRNEAGKRTTDYESIGGHLDMLFWNFIQISEIPYFILSLHYANYQTYKEFIPNIGKKVAKCSISREEENGKPFQSGEKINTVKGLTIHPFLEIPAYTFVEDDSIVECRRCKVVETVEENKNPV